MDRAAQLSAEVHRLAHPTSPTAMPHPRDAPSPSSCVSDSSSESSSSPSTVVTSSADGPTIIRTGTVKLQEASRQRQHINNIQLVRQYIQELPLRVKSGSHTGANDFLLIKFSGTQFRKPHLERQHGPNLAPNMDPRWPKTRSPNNHFC